MKEGKKKTKQQPHTQTHQMDLLHSCQRAVNVNTVINFLFQKWIAFNSDLLNFTALVTPSCMLSFLWVSLLNHPALLHARDQILDQWNNPCTQISAIRLGFDQSLPLPTGWMQLIKMYIPPKCSLALIYLILNTKIIKQTNYWTWYK